MTLNLGQDEFCDENTLIRDWAAAVRAFFEDPGMGSRLGTALIAKGIRTLANLRARRRSALIEILREHEDLGVYLVDDLEKLAKYSVVDDFSFPVLNDEATHAREKARQPPGGAKEISFREFQAVIPEHFDAQRDIQRLPGIIAHVLPVHKLLTPTGGLSQVTSAACAFMFLKYGAVHYALAAEGIFVREAVVEWAVLPAGAVGGNPSELSCSAYV